MTGDASDTASDDTEEPTARTPADDDGDSDGTSPSRRDVLAGAAASTVAAGLGVAGASGTALAGDDDGDDDDDDDDDTRVSATVEFRNQESDGTTVTVAETTLSDDGYVAIHDATLLDGAVLDSVIGVSDYLEAGLHEDVEIELFDVEGADFDEDELEETQPLVPMPHRETGDNETYEFVDSDGEEDGPFTLGGAPVVDIGFVVVD